MARMTSLGFGGTCLCPVGNPVNCPGGRGCSADPEICRAVAGKRLVEFDYDGYHRVVEPHYYGRNRRDNDALSAYQTNWGGKRSAQPDWHMFLVGRMTGISATSATFDQTRPGYNPNDRTMTGYYARVE